MKLSSMTKEYASNYLSNFSPIAIARAEENFDFLLVALINIKKSICVSILNEEKPNADIIKKYEELNSLYTNIK